MTVGPENVTIYCGTLLGLGIGRCEGKLIRHGKGPLSPLMDGPFVEFLSPGKRKLWTLIADRGNPYLLILRGVGYPDPPAPFASQPGSKLANGFSPPRGNAVFDRVFAFAEHSLLAFDPRYETAFDDFINSYAEHFIADYRQSAIPQSTPNAKTPISRPSAMAETRETESGGDAVPDSTEPVVPFDPVSIQDERRRALALKVLRPGQKIFREKLMRAYGGRCAITGCNVSAALDAAHIIPYCGPESDHVRNGLLLRLDLHALFDAYLLSIEPEELKLRLGAGLRGGYYEIINNRELRLPEDVASRPNYEALSQHYREFTSREGSE
jgi:hypothetical protein